MTRIPVVLCDATECRVDKDELQFLLATGRVMSFKRSDHWVVIGRDPIRRSPRRNVPQERRYQGVFARDYWY